MDYTHKNNFLETLWEGFSSSLSLRPQITLPERLKSKKTGLETDTLALKKDWEKVGQDLRSALNDYENSSKL